MQQKRSFNSENRRKAWLSLLLLVALAALFLSVLVGGVCGSIFASRSLAASSEKAFSDDFKSIVANLATLLTQTMQQDCKSLGVLAAAVASQRGGSFADFTRISEAARATSQQEILEWAPKVDDAERTLQEAAICSAVFNSTSCVMKQVLKVLSESRAALIS